MCVYFRADDISSRAVAVCLCESIGGGWTLRCVTAWCGVGVCTDEISTRRGCLTWRNMHACTWRTRACPMEPL